MSDSDQKVNRNIQPDVGTHDMMNVSTWSYDWPISTYSPLFKAIILYYHGKQRVAYNNDGNPNYYDVQTTSITK